MPAGAMMSLNMTGFGAGNVFLNGVHVSYFDLTFGECFHPPGAFPRQHLLALQLSLEPEYIAPPFVMSLV